MRGLGGGWKRELSAAVVVVFGAHAFAYFLINVLPDATLIGLGLEGAKGEVLATLQAEAVRRPYVETFLGLLTFDLGRTIDGVPVSAELGRAAALSGPRIIGAFGLVCAAALITAFLGRIPRTLVAFLSFLPPYVSAFLALLALLAVGAASPGDPMLGAACTLALAISPAMLVVGQAAAITQRNLASEFARTLTSIGADDLFLRKRLLANLTAELVPSLEKVFVMIAAGLLFAEPILGLPGLGTTAVRALRRADPDLVLGATLLFAFSVVLARLAAVSVRRQFGLAT